MHARLIVGITAGLLFVSTAARAQYYQTDFPADEFRSRHAKVFEQIGAAAVAVVQGMPQTEGYTLPRQHNTFYYLSGHRDARRLPAARRPYQEGDHLPPGAQPAARSRRRPRPVSGRRRSRHAHLRRRPGQAAPADGRHQLAADQPTGAPAPGGGGRSQAPAVIFAEFSPAENQGQSRGELVSAETARVNDPWDGTGSRQRRFVELLRARHPRAELRNLNPDSRRDAEHQEPARDRDGAAGLADCRPRD